MVHHGNTPRLAVMLSGGGRTLENLLDVIDIGELDAEVALVIASRECRGAEVARSRGIDTCVVDGEIPTEALDRLLDEVGAEWLLLAGYLRRVHMPARLAGQCVNIHPALLPMFGGTGMYGNRLHQAVLDAYRNNEVTESGCTVHLVDDQYDHGHIVLQMRCPIMPDDTIETLAARVFELECRAYPDALRKLLGQ